MNTASADFPKKSADHEPAGRRKRFASSNSPKSNDEARWVAGKLRRIQRAGRRWRDFAVLYRAHNHRDALVRNFRGAKIPLSFARLSIWSIRSSKI